MRFYLFLLLFPLFSIGQNTITPSSAVQGDYLQVFISGTSQDFYEDYSDCNTYTRLVNSNDYSSTIDMQSSYYNSNAGGIYEYINTSGKPLGSYDLETRGCQTNWNWQILATDVFTILPPPQISNIFPNEVLVNSWSVYFNHSRRKYKFFRRLL